MEEEEERRCGDKWRSSRGGEEINEGWSKNGASHECACVSNHEQHIYCTQQQTIPSSLKRDSHVCVCVGVWVGGCVWV